MKMFVFLITKIHSHFHYLKRIFTYSLFFFLFVSFPFFFNILGNSVYSLVEFTHAYKSKSKHAQKYQGSS